MNANTEAITDLLHSLGRPQSGPPVGQFGQIYRQLHGMARRQLAGESSQCTLNPTALVNEAWLRLGPEQQRYRHRGHFFAAASQAMRRILVDHARARLASKRGAGAIAVPLQPEWPSDLPPPEELADLDAVLTRLEALDTDLARVVCMRCFGGFTVNEIAEIDDVTERTVFRHWATARSWLDLQLRRAV